jgi:hypothetical protein
MTEMMSIADSRYMSGPRLESCKKLNVSKYSIKMVAGFLLSMTADMADIIDIS